MKTVVKNRQPSGSVKATQRRIGFLEVFFSAVKFAVTKVPLMLRHKDKIFYTSEPKDDSIGRYLEANAIKYADKAALICEEGTWTYKQYNEEVNRLANYLISLGIKKGDVFVVLMENQPEILFCLGAAAKIGASASMVNFNLRDKALHHCMTIEPFKAIVVGEGLVKGFEEIRGELSLTPDFPVYWMADGKREPMPEGYQDLKKIMAASSAANPATTNTVNSHDTFAFVFTSGTTGLPKAAYQYHRSWIKVGLAMGKLMLKLTPEDRWYCCLPFFHTNPVKIAWGCAHQNGAALVMVRKFSASRFWEDVRKYKVTAFNYIGELCTYLMNNPETPEDRSHTLAKMLGNGMRPDVYGAFMERFRVKQIIEVYGASEFDLGFNNFFNLSGTVGFSFNKFALVKYDMDNDDLARDENGFLIKVKKGEPGIVLGEAKESVDITGYTSKEATEKKMIYDAFEKGDRWFNTGDMLRNIGWGHHEFVDRTGDTFRWKGENVSTMEVEKIVNSFDQVDQSTAYGIKFGQGDGRLGMVAVLPHAKPDEFDLEGFGRLLSASLPAYAIPRFMRFKTEFEMTPTHKIKKVGLREDGFDLNKIDDPIFVLLPGRDTYQPLTEAIAAEILEGRYRF
ncbi:MAG: long-chain-acyl-CoA synthetase [Deltaproteobacteria bacterium]|jgi:citronellyl-CoA synthetase|nr:long-chain-acyl-CoA synthetase [Deltaproteobacteria bacterium]MBT4641566.1 long-chain-acyl-CoA synthetase [Deltaproteobacteria bacterium]MBT6499376.1 long-chain-acyl-CoA synthetase [Deltaproteobacteria bacterium]MBT6611030.1 long-chain-acyl-CoA synthetase [Deltaproteobacteria bacterium]MBT7710250.1 long-chain-acyl-CoA synthetase [Deltaproteobacteria bacterium]